MINWLTIKKAGRERYYESRILISAAMKPSLETPERIAESLEISVAELVASGQWESLSALARHFKVSRARVTQVMNLLSLSTDVIDIIRSLGDPINSPVVAERRLRPLLSLLFRLANRRSRLKRCCSRMLKNRHNISSLANGRYCTVARTFEVYYGPGKITVQQVG